MLRIAAPNSFFLDWIRLNFRSAIDEACKTVLGRSAELEFVVQTAAEVIGPGQPTTREPACDAGPPDVPPPLPKEDDRGDDGEKKMISSSNQVKRERTKAEERKAGPHGCNAVKPEAGPAFGPRKFASLSSFVVGPAIGWPCIPPRWSARNPGQITPLFVYGPTSVGKTHLLEGIWSAERKAGRGTTTIYLSAEQFTSQFLEALRGGGMPVFRRKYRGVRVLILDDLQFLAGKRATQVELMHTVDTLLREGPAIGLRRRSARRPN